MNATVQTDYRYCVIATYGRTGSTLLQGLLNCVPGVLIRGENTFLVRAFYDVHRRLVASVRKADNEKASQPQHPWFGAGEFDPDAAIVALRELLVRQLTAGEDGAHAVVGFKEIRWGEVDLASPVAFLDFMDLLLPGLLYIVQTRDLTEVRGSGFWRQSSTGEFMDSVSDVLGFQHMISFHRPNSSISLDYAELLDDPVGAISMIAERLGRPFGDREAEAVERTMQLRHSYDNRLNLADAGGDG